MVNPTEQDQPLLGLATTDHLLRELEARLEVDNVGDPRAQTEAALSHLRMARSLLTREQREYRTVGS